MISVTPDSLRQIVTEAGLAHGLQRIAADALAERVLERIAEMHADVSAMTRRKIQRDHALAYLVRVLDPARRMTRNAHAYRIEQRLARFASTAWPRIAAGSREPRDDMERALATLCRTNCAGSRRRIADALRGMDAFRPTDSGYLGGVPSQWSVTNE